LAFDALLDVFLAVRLIRTLNEFRSSEGKKHRTIVAVDSDRARNVPAREGADYARPLHPRR
jgi:hypothetical protein